MLLALLVVAATPPALSLEWNAPDGCPSREQLEAEVKRLRGEVRLAPDASTATLVVRAEVRPAWSVELQTVSRGVPGRRSVAGRTCRAATEAAAAVIALALADPLASPPPVVVESTPPPAAPAPPSRNTVALGLEVAGQSGPLRSVAAGAGLSLAWVWDAVRVEVAAFTPSSEAVSHGPATAQLSVPLRGELAVRVPLWRGLWLRAQGGFGASVVRPVFQIDATEVYRAPFVTGQASAGLEWLF